MESWALLEFCSLLIHPWRRVRWTWSPDMWLVNHSIEILQMEQSHRCYKVIMSLPAEPPSTLEPRMIWESRYNKRSGSLKYPTYIRFVHDCVEASSQDTPEWKFPSFFCHLGFSFRVKIIKICHHVAIWMREIESCLGMKWNGGRKILTSAQPPSEASTS